MKKIITKFFLISLFTSICFFGIDRVYASSQVFNPDMYLDNYGMGYSTGSNLSSFTPLTTNMKLTFSSNTYLNIQTKGVLYNSTTMVEPTYIHARLSFCTNGNFSSGWSGSDYVYDVFFTGYNGIKCNIYGGGQGYLVQATYKVDPFDNNGLRMINNAITSNVTAPISISFLGAEFGLQAFPRYNADDSVITKMDELIRIIGSTSNNDVVSKINETNKKLQETNDTLNDDDTSESSNKASEFFSGFTTDTHGLTSIITAPLTLIGSITSSTCSPLGLKVPFVENKTLNLPCMSSIYKNNFGSFMTVYQTITFGIVAYWVCVRIFALVKDFKNPEKDEVEVMDL